MNRTFTGVDDTGLKNVIEQAQLRLVFIAPGVRVSVAQTLVNAIDALPAEAIHLVLEVDAEGCRLGYGDQDLSGLEYLQAGASQHGLTVNHHPGIRIGLLIADETTLI